MDKKNLKKQPKKMVTPTPLLHTSLPSTSDQTDQSFASCSTLNNSFDEQKLNTKQNKFKRMEVKKKSSKKTEEDLNILYGDYLHTLYHEMALKEQLEEERKRTESNLLRLKKEVEEKEVLHFKGNKNKEIAKNIIQLQSELEGVGFKNEFENAVSEASKLETDLKDSGIPTVLHDQINKLRISNIEINKLRISNIEINKDDSMYSTDYFTQSFEGITNDYAIKMETEQTLDIQEDLFRECEEKLQTLEDLTTYNASLYFSLKETHQ